MQCRYERITAAVAIKDQGLSYENWRTASSVNRWVCQLAVFPNRFAIQVETRGSLMSEVHINSVFLDKRRRRGMTILAMDWGSRAAVFHKNFDVPLRLPCGFFERDQTQ